MSQVSIALGKKIRAIRKEMKLSRAEFSELVEMSEDAIGLIERGITSPRLENLIKIAQKLELSIDQLINYSPRNSHSSKKKQELYTLNNFLKAKSSKQIKLIHEIARDIFKRKEY